VNHDGANVDGPSVCAQSECKTLKQENHAYMGNDYQDDNVGRNKII
jgi:predicted phage-related endonuclease